MNTIYTFPYKGKKHIIKLLLLFLISVQLMHSASFYQMLNEATKVSGQTNVTANDLTNDFETYAQTELKSLRTVVNRENIKNQTPEEFFQNISNSVWDLTGYYLSDVYLSDKTDRSLIFINSQNLFRSPPVIS